MSSVETSIVNPNNDCATDEIVRQRQPAQNVQHKNYKGFVAGVFSGISKLSGKIAPRFLGEKTLLILACSWASVRLF